MHASGEFDFCERLPDHALEEILARVPFRAVGAARCVSKRWRAVATSWTFLSLHSARQELAESWLYVNGFRYRTTDSVNDGTNTQASAEEGDHSRGAGGVAYSVVPDDDRRLQYKLSLLDTHWLETPVMPEARAQPIVAAVTNLPRGAHKLVVAGGGTSKEPLSSVCLFDSESQSWSYCEDLPMEFKGLVTSRSVTAVVCNRKFYLFHIYSGLVASLDVGTKRWSAVRTLRPPGMHYCYLALRRGELLAVGVSHENDRFRFFGWRVDHHTLQCTGPSWPVLCHFGSLKSSNPSRNWQSKKAPSSSTVPVTTTDTLVSLLRTIPACAGIIGFFNRMLQFVKAVS